MMTTDLTWSARGYLAWIPGTTAIRIHRKPFWALGYSEGTKLWHRSVTVITLQGVDINKTRQGNPNDKFSVALSKHARTTPFSKL